MDSWTAMHARGRGFCKKRDLAAGLGVMLGRNSRSPSAVGLFRFDSGQPMVGRVGAGLSHR